MTALRTTASLALAAATVVTARADAAATAESLRARFDAAVAAIEAEDTELRETLAREYLTRLRQIERRGRWRRRDTSEVRAERERFEAERSAPLPPFSADPELSRLQAILAGATAPLQHRQTEAKLALANAYLFRLGHALGRGASASEFNRLALPFALPATADGTSDLAPSPASRTELSPSPGTPAGELAFAIGSLSSVPADARLRLVPIRGATQPTTHELSGPEGTPLAAWPAPAQTYGTVLIDVQAAIESAIEARATAFVVRLSAPAAYALGDTVRAFHLRPRLLIDDASARLVPSPSPDAPPTVETFPPTFRD